MCCEEFPELRTIGNSPVGAFYAMHVAIQRILSKCSQLPILRYEAISTHVVSGPDQLNPDAHPTMRLVILSDPHGRHEAI